MRSWVLAGAVVIVAAVGATACSGGDGDEGSFPLTTESTENEPGPAGSSMPTDSPMSTANPIPTGNPVPEDDSGDVDEGEGEETSPLADVDPCTLVPDEAFASLGLDESYPHDIGTGNGCRFTRRAETGDLYIHDVVIRLNGGLDDLPDLPDDITLVPLPNIGGHEAIESAGAGGRGSCTVLIGVTESSRVDVGLIAGTDGQLACDLAHQLATFVVSELP